MLLWAESQFVPVSVPWCCCVCQLVSILPAVVTKVNFNLHCYIKYSKHLCLFCPTRTAVAVSREKKPKRL